MDDTVDLYHIKQYPILQWRRQVQIHKGSAWIRFDSIPHNGLDYYVWSIQSTPKKHGTSSQVAHHENQFIIESRHMCQGTEWTDGRSPMSCLIGPCSMYPMIFKTFRIIYTVLLYPMILAQGQDRTGQDIVTLCTLHCSLQNEAKPTTVHYIQSDCALDHQVCNVLYCTVLDAHLWIPANENVCACTVFVFLCFVFFLYKSTVVAIFFKWQCISLLLTWLDLTWHTRVDSIPAIVITTESAEKRFASGDRLIQMKKWRNQAYFQYN